MNWLTSVIDRLANFSSRFAWPLPFTAFWGGERKRPLRPTTCPSAKTWGKRQSSLQCVQPPCKKYEPKIHTHFCSDQMGRTSTVACDCRQTTGGENLGPHLRDDRHGDRSPLAETTFVRHFVQMTRGTAGAQQMEARIAGKAQ